MFGVPNRIIQLIVLVIVLGFPIALVLAWVFELTPEGLKRTEDCPTQRVQQSRGKTWIYIVIIGATLSIGLILSRKVYGGEK